MKGEMAIETVAKLFLVLIVLSLSVALIANLFEKAQENVEGLGTNGEGEEGSVTIGPLDRTSNEAIGALVYQCYGKWQSSPALEKENICYTVYLSEGEFSDYGITSTNIEDASSLGSNGTTIGSLDTDKIIILYDLESDKVVIR